MKSFTDTISEHGYALIVALVYIGGGVAYVLHRIHVQRMRRVHMVANALERIRKIEEKHRLCHESALIVREFKAYVARERILQQRLCRAITLHEENTRPIDRGTTTEVSAIFSTKA